MVRNETQPTTTTLLNVRRCTENSRDSLKQYGGREARHTDFFAASDATNEVAVGPVLPAADRSPSLHLLAGIREEERGAEFVLAEITDYFLRFRCDHKLDKGLAALAVDLGELLGIDLHHVVNIEE